MISSPTVDDKLTELFRLAHPKAAICNLSFSIGSGKYSNSVLASIGTDGHLYVWNLDKKVKIFEDDRLDPIRLPHGYRYYTVTFMDDLYDLNDKTDLQQKTTIESPQFIKFLTTELKKDSNYFILLVTNSNGVLFEYKVPKYLTNSDTFKPYSVPFKIKQYKYDKTFSVLMPTSFQISNKKKIKKGDNQIYVNNNNFPIMIQVVQRNYCFNFMVSDLMQKRIVQEIPSFANIIANIDFCRMDPNKAAIPDVGGFVIWNTTKFER